MRLARMRLRNFRGYHEVATVDFGHINVLLGKNDAGKSSILDALNIFLGDARPDAGDTNASNLDQGFAITCIFDDLPSEIILDPTRMIRLNEAYLLNADNQLELCKEYDADPYGPREAYLVANHPVTDKIQSSLLELNFSELKRIAIDLLVKRNEYSKVDLSSKSELRNYIWHSHASDSTVKFAERKISIGRLGKEDARSLLEKLRFHLPYFALFKSDRANIDRDDEAQHLLRGAVKSAIDANIEALMAVSHKILAQVHDRTEATLEHLKKFSTDLANHIVPEWPTPRWESMFRISLKTDDNVPLNKRGSGTRRLILLSFLQAEAERKAAGNSNLIYGIEEPEAAQHPDNQKKIFETLRSLASSQKHQIILTTHNPALANMMPFDSIRYVERTKTGSKIHALSPEGPGIEEIAKSLGILPNHNCRLVLLCEGETDINFLVRFSRLCAKYPNLKDYEKQGKLIWAPLKGRGNLKYCLQRIARLNTPTFVLCDGDNAKRHSEFFNHADSAFETERREIENYVHPSIIKEVFGKVIEASPTNYAKMDIPKYLALSTEYSEAAIKHRMSHECAYRMTYELLQDLGVDKEVDKWMQCINRYLKVD